MLESVGQIVGILVGMITVMGVFYRIALRPMKKKFEQVVELVPIVEKIRAEVTPNGGGSMKDSVVRIERTANHALKQLGELANHVHAHGHRLRVSFRQSELAIFETDAEGRFVWVSDEYVRICGRPREDVLGANWINSVCPDDRDGVWAEWESASRHARDFDMTYTLWKVDGSQLDVRGHAECIRSPGGKVMGYLGTVVEQKKTG